MVAINTNECEVSDLYKLLISTVLPRPIAWVTSTHESGVINLAPFSAYNMVCSIPTTVAFSIGYKADGKEKDTLANILRQKEFVINTPRPEHVEAVALSAALFPAGESEVEAAGLELADSMVVKTPRLRDAVFSLECELYQTLQIGERAPGGAMLVIGSVRVFHIQDEIYENGKIQFDKARVLSRLGGYCYGISGEVIEQRVPDLKTL